MKEHEITSLLKRIGDEIGIVFSRQSDRERISRYLDNGGVLPKPHAVLPTELINLVTTNETYFEREKHHFDYLTQTILPKLSQSYSPKPIRILCAPCSSGEEPYSIALRILESSYTFNNRNIEIIGVDISEDVIQKAKIGNYSQRSVHALSPEILSRYFVRERDHYRILPISHINIRFQSGNLFDTSLWNSLGDFDIIFSRNMMIYFDKAKNLELLKKFREHLNGYLIIGHADDHLQAKEVFTPLHTAQGIIYRLH